MLPAMTNSPDMRAGDEDRDRTVSLIREAFTEGRLTNDEFQDRLAKAQQARTFGDLDALTTDLPAMPPGTAKPAGTAAANPEDDHTWRNLWGSWLTVALITNVIWGLTWITNTDRVPYYWPFWVMVPWGAVILVGWIAKRWR